MRSLIERVKRIRGPRKHVITAITPGDTLILVHNGAAWATLNMVSLRTEYISGVPVTTATFSSREPETSTASPQTKVSWR